MKMEDLSTLDLAYIEGFVEKCAGLNVDPEMFLESLVGEEKEAKGDKPCPGSKIKSKGKGRGKGHGKGEGPIGVPTGEKEKKAAYDKVVDLLKKKAMCGKEHGAKSKSKDKKVTKKSALKDAIKQALAAKK
jgi:hypothetical protein